MILFTEEYGIIVLLISYTWLFINLFSQQREDWVNVLRLSQYMETWTWTLTFVMDRYIIEDRWTEIQTLFDLKLLKEQHRRKELDFNLPFNCTKISKFHLVQESW